MTDQASYQAMLKRREDILTKCRMHGVDDCTAYRIYDVCGDAGRPLLVAWSHAWGEDCRERTAVVADYLIDQDQQELSDTFRKAVAYPVPEYGERAVARRKGSQGVTVVVAYAYKGNGVWRAVWWRIDIDQPDGVVSVGNRHKTNDLRKKPIGPFPARVTTWWIRLKVQEGVCQ